MARTIAKDHDAKRRLILERAAQLFADQGFDRASVAQVAQACAISKANIYHYYASKDEILFDILNDYLSGLRDAICEMDLGGLGIEDQFRATVAGILMAYEGADNQHRLQASGLPHLPSEQQRVLIGYQRDLVRHLSGLVEAIAPSVFMGDEAKLRAATMSVFGMLNWFYMWNRDSDETARKAYAQVVCDICLKGLPGI